MNTVFQEHYTLQQIPHYQHRPLIEPNKCHSVGNKNCKTVISDEPLRSRFEIQKSILRSFGARTFHSDVSKHSSGKHGKYPKKITKEKGRIKPFAMRRRNRTRHKISFERKQNFPPATEVNFHYEYLGVASELPEIPRGKLFAAGISAKISYSGTRSADSKLVDDSWPGHGMDEGQQERECFDFSVVPRPRVERGQRVCVASEGERCATHGVITGFSVYLYQS